MTTRISIVIPSWNGKALLADCLASIEAQTFRDHETIVVDDGSTDGTSEFVSTRYPQVRLKTLPVNQGFCTAVNSGIDMARGDLVFLLNNDMTLAADCLERLALAADSSSASLFAPLVLWRDDPQTIYAAGDLQRRGGRPESIGFRAPLQGFHFPERVFGVTAGAGLYRRQVFERIGLFDSKFNIYFSDSDISFRARLAGHSAALVKDALAYHVGFASLSGKTLKRTRQCFINHVMLVVKNMPLGLMARNSPAILAERLHQAHRLFSDARTEYGAVRALLEIARAGIDVARLLPHAVVERRRIQRLRTISLRDLEALLDP